MAGTKKRPTTLDELCAAIRRENEIPAGAFTVAEFAEKSGLKISTAKDRLYNMKLDGRARSCGPRRMYYVLT